MASRAVCFVARLAKGVRPLASPRFAHPIPQSRRRGHAGLNQRFLSLQLFFQPNLDQGLVGHVAPVRRGLDPLQHVLGQPQ